jgi:phospholipid-binding lipoprotein MlaA
MNDATERLAGRIPPSPPAKQKRVLRRLLILSAGALAACAQVPADPAARAEFERTNDPAEPTNRAIFAGNQFVDHNALQPVARGYLATVPAVARSGIHNFTSNLAEPSIAVNDVLQGNLSRAWTTTQRFAINTTAGGVGLFDVATGWDRPGHQADFGQTLGVWGVGPGPAVQLPLFGPSNARDSVGKVASLVTNPFNFATGGAATAVGAASGALGMVDGRAGALDFTKSTERTSLDYYATLRSLSAQRRASLVAEGKNGEAAYAPPANSASSAGQLPSAPGS